MTKTRSVVDITVHSMSRRKIVEMKRGRALRKALRSAQRANVCVNPHSPDGDDFSSCFYFDCALKDPAQIQAPLTRSSQQPLWRRTNEGYDDYGIQMYLLGGWRQGPNYADKVGTS